MAGDDLLRATTLDEPVMDTVKRDLHVVWTKLKKVAIPTEDTKTELRNWDLWGPLFLCLLLAIMLRFTNCPSLVSHRLSVD